MKVKYILFDMDGVLVDSMPLHVSSWKKAFNDYNLEVLEDDLYHLGGVSFQDTIEIISKKNDIKIDLDDKIKIHKLKIKYFNLGYEPKPFDNILENLKLLKNKGFKLALVSGAIREVVDEIVNNYFENIFEIIISSDDVKFSKPNPEPYLLALKNFNAKKEECIIIEDAINGIKSGKSAGIKVFALETTHKREELFEADIVFENHKKLFDYLLR